MIKFTCIVLTLLYYFIAQAMATIQKKPSVHRQMSQNELHHIFGVKNEADVPDYHITHPIKNLISNDKHELIVNDKHQQFIFELEPHDHLLSQHIVSSIRLHNTSLEDLKFPQKSNCIYLGKSSNLLNTHISLVGCGNKMRGFISTAGSDYIFLHPLLPRHIQTHPDPADPTNSTHAHVIYKRSAPIFNAINTVTNDAYEDFNSPHEKSCLFSSQEDPYPDTTPLPLSANLLSRHTLVSLPEHKIPEEELYIPEERLPVIKGPFTIELGVFSDDAMWDHFKELYGSDAEVELQQFALASVNNIHLLYSHRSIDPKINMRITRYEVMKETPSLIDKRRHRNGEVDLLLEGFCQHQDNINAKSDADPTHWDHALLFSGYDLYRGNLKSVAGYAPVKGMCSGIRSCTINEGLDFGAVFVITHEMGHSLGMYHDGDNGCDSRCCIMSPSVGSGKTSWSDCSVKEFTRFVTKLGTGFLPDNCLIDGSHDRTLLDHSQGSLPGQKYTLEQQCRIFHGECWTHELRDGQELNDVCEMVWCGAGEGIIRTAHPALEGTYCGSKKWCIEGVCTAFRGSNPRVINGGWSSWNDRPGGACGVACSDCEIDSQLRVRRSIRLCEKPAPNNGGTDCPGALVRGLICDDTKCKGKSPDEHASEVCAKLRGDSSTPDLLLSGKGFQYEDSPCKIWCHMTVNNFIRSVGNFPDGTPCGKQKFCVKGLCHKLGCHGDALVESDADCPPSNHIDIASNSGRPAPPPIRQSPTIIDTKDLRPRWTLWSPWSSCSRSCGRGLQVRIRRCSSGGCAGNARQAIPCQTQICPSRSQKNNPPEILQSLDAGWSTWESWSTCDASCEVGKQLRQRRCLGTPCHGLRFQYQSCGGQPCPPVNSDWSTWAGWSHCTRTCGGGIQYRARSCKSTVCEIGTSSQARACNRHQCPVPVNANDPLVPAAWSFWSGWSSCSRTCSGGTQFRRRHCSPGSGSCYGSNIDYSTCNSQSCKPKLQFSSPSGSNERRKEALGKWTSWSPWAVCSASCGGGLMKRTRLCFNSHVAACFGSPIETQTCNVLPCEEVENTVDDDNNELSSGISLILFGDWGTWGEWLACSCSSQTQKRFRRCNRNPPCPGSWSQDQHCPVNCDSIHQLRSV